MSNHDVVILLCTLLLHTYTREEWGLNLCKVKKYSPVETLQSTHVSQTTSTILAHNSAVYA